VSGMFLSMSEYFKSIALLFLELLKYLNSAVSFTCLVNVIIVNIKILLSKTNS